MWVLVEAGWAAETAEAAEEGGGGWSRAREMRTPSPRPRQVGEGFAEGALVIIEVRAASRV